MVIISNDEYNDDNPDIIVVTVTSNLTIQNQYGIGIDDHNLEGGQLPLKSQIQCDKIYTLSKEIVVKKFNKVNTGTFELIQQKLHSLVDHEK